MMKAILKDSLNIYSSHASWGTFKNNFHNSKFEHSSIIITIYPGYNIAQII